MKRKKDIYKQEKEGFNHQNLIENKKQIKIHLI